MKLKKILEELNLELELSDQIANLDIGGDNVKSLSFNKYDNIYKILYKYDNKYGCKITINYNNYNNNGAFLTISTKTSNNKIIGICFTYSGGLRAIT